MHVALLAAIDLSPFASDAEVEAAAERAVGLARAVEAHPSLPLAVHLGACALARVAGLAGDVLALLATGEVEWIRRGWSAPHFVMLTDASRDLQLRREHEVLEAHGLAPGGLQPGGDWEPGLVPSFVRNGIDRLLLPSSLLGDGGPAVVEHLGVVLQAVPIIDAPADPRGWLEEGERHRSDGLVVVVMPPADDPREVAEEWQGLPGCDLTTPGAYLAAHTAGRRVFPPTGPWQQRLAASPAGELLYRKMLRVGRRISDRTPDETVDRVLAAQTASAYDPDPAAHPVRLAAHAQLVAAAGVLESRGRGDWARARRVDWDADGRSEIHVELPELSLVVDPHDGAAIAYLDDKPRMWPATVLPPEAATPSIVLCRFLPDGHPDAEPLPILPLEAVAVEEQRGGVSLTMEGGDGWGQVWCELTVRGRSLLVRYRIEGMPSARFGPELPLALDAGGVRARVDGGAWVDVDTTGALAGHRFRIADDDRQILIGSPTPAQMFARPVAGHGVVVWAHWIVAGSGRYEAAIDLAP